MGTVWNGCSMVMYLFTTICLSILMSKFQISYAGHVYAGSVLLSESPTLQYLVKCGYVAEQDPRISTSNIYKGEILVEGLMEFQRTAGLQVSGVSGEVEEQLMNGGSCDMGEPQNLPVYRVSDSAPMKKEATMSIAHKTLTFPNIPESVLLEKELPLSTNDTNSPSYEVPYSAPLKKE